jgi:hypothetical protein
MVDAEPEPEPEDQANEEAAPTWHASLLYGIPGYGVAVYMRTEPYGPAHPS